MTTPINNPYLASFLSEPSLVSPYSRDQFEASLNALANAPKLQELLASESATDDFWPEPGSWRAQFRPYSVKEGILHVPIKGVLLHGFGYQFFGLATGYEYIQKAIERGMADEEVRGIALIINSPGGHVAGNFDLVDRIFAGRANKPIHAFVDEHAYSAAYSIASAAETITVARTGGTGSIGVVTMHVDISKALDKFGIKVTYIYAGKHKVDGNPTEPLPEGVLERIQARVDGLYDVFVATVARNRGLDEKEVRKTEALTFSASESLSNKLADQIGSLGDGLAAFAANLKPKTGGTDMSKEKDEKATVDQATIDNAKAEGVTEGKAAGAKAERERIAGVLNSEEAKTRREAAVNIALTTDLSVDQAKSLLATLPQSGAENPAAGKNGFEEAMDKSENPDLGAGPGQQQVSAADTILADYTAATGFGKK